MLPVPIPTSVDLASFAELKQKAARDDPRALAEAAVQFEALFIGMMLKSARDASLGAGILDNSQTQQYLELMDQQVALDLARSGGFGFGKMLLEQLGAAPVAAPTPPPIGAAVHVPPAAHFPRGLPATLLAPPATPAEVPAAFDRAPSADSDPAKAFVARFADDAAAAARRLGIPPKLLLAQAALETGWGDATPRHPDGRPTHNMFGIKAGSTWTGDSVAHWTLENAGGIAMRKRELFRAYPSSTASFADYVELIAGSPRYAPAVQHAASPEGYVQALTAAGYATDPAYGEKWLSIYRGERLTGALADLKHTAFEPTQ